MSAFAADYPVDDTLNAYPHGPVTSYGDDLFLACTIPTGWYAEIVQQPTYGIVTLYFPGGFEFNMTNPPSVNTLDQFTYRLTDGNGNYSNIGTVYMNMAVEM